MLHPAHPNYIANHNCFLARSDCSVVRRYTAALDISLTELFSEPQPVSDKKEALLSELRDLVQGLSVESLRKIIAILQNILSGAVSFYIFSFEHEVFSDTYYNSRSRLSNHAPTAIFLHKGECPCFKIPNT